jgi:hypothetical protein
MSPEILRHSAADQAVHERARMLAAEAVDGPLEPGDAEWMDAHLAGCADCAAVAEEYRFIHVELRSLAAPLPPRDLWARTSAALDLVDARAPGSSRGLGVARTGNRPLIATAVAVGIVVVVASASLFAQSPIATPSTGPLHSAIVAVATPSAVPSGQSPQEPLAVVDGTSYWIASDSGVYQIKGGATECTASDGSCTVADGGSTVGTVSSDQSVSAAIAPDASLAAVWTGDKVVIMPLGSNPPTVSMDKLTPQPTLAPTVAPTLAPTVAPTAVPTASPSASPLVIPSETSATTPAITPAPSESPSQPPATVSPAAIQAEPIAILSGYEIVGRDPEFSADGNLVAFAARPVDHSTGPDVFVWRTGQAQATRITFRHSGLFAGWFGGRVMISEISGQAGGAAASAQPGSALGSTSFIYDPASDTALQINRPMLLPAVDPTGRYLVYWAGTVERDPATGLWQPGSGDLYFDSWSDLELTPVSLSAPAAPTTAPSAAPTAVPSPSDVPTDVPSPTAEPSALDASPSSSPSITDAAPTVSPAITAAPPSSVPQPLPVAAAPGMVRTWSVAWDDSGSHVAIWVADPGSSTIGRLSLFAIDPSSGRVKTDDQLMANDKVISNVTFDAGRLIYTSAIDGKTYMQTVPALTPSTVATPLPPTPGPSSSGEPESPSPIPTDRPGS